MSWRERVPVFAAALWWGSLTAVAFVVVPLLFVHLPSAALAGQTAARLFTAQTWITVGCCALLLLASRPVVASPPMDWAGGALAFVVVGMLLALLAEFAVAPRIIARDNLKLWHGVGSGMYLLQWCCAGGALWKTSALSSRA